MSNVKYASSSTLWRSSLYMMFDATGRETVRQARDGIASAKVIC
jgi:hypothetical protein